MEDVETQMRSEQDNSGTQSTPLLSSYKADIAREQDDSAGKHIPLLASYVDRCPGCVLERKKAASQGSLPFKDLSVVALLYLANSLPICSLYSFVYFMVEDLNIAKSDTQISTYSGYLGSALLFGRFITSTPWGIVADKYGHKPVIFSGTAAIFIFNTLFGFSTNYWMALTSRFLLGLSNGMTGTLTAYASAICRQEHQAVAMSVMGTMWGFGLIVGPAIGGYLAQPSTKLPTIFPSGSLFDLFPYALPCIFISAFALAGFSLSFFLPETIHNHCSSNLIFDEEIQNDVREAIISSHDRADISNNEVQDLRKPLWTNRGLIGSIILVCFWVIHATAYSETFSLWAVSPTLYGGLDFTSSEVADVLSISGVAILVFQVLLFPLFAKSLGPIELVRLSALLTTILVILYPLFHRLQGVMLWSVVLSVSTVKNVLSVSGFTGIFMLTNNSVENAEKGVANGVSATMMSAVQAFGPALAGAMISLGEERMDASFLPGMWMVFTLLAVLSFLTCLATLKLFLPPSLNKST